jgi:hypothetical protein
MAFPVSPTEGQTFTEDNTVWIYSAVTGQWNRSVVNPGNSTDYRSGKGYVGSDLDVNGDITLDDGGTFTTTLQTVTPTANRTISFPNATGTVGLVAGSSGQLVYNNAGANAGVPSTVVGATGDVTLALNGAASTPPLELTGTWFTGGGATATKPQLLIEPAGTTSNAWSPDGTGLGVNAASTFTGRLLDLQRNGTSRTTVDASGQITLGNIFSSYTSGTQPQLTLYGTTSNFYGFHVGNSFDFNINAGGATSGGQGVLRFHTAANERARIDSSGDVLINTTASPIAFFDGKLRAASSTTVTSFRCTGVAGAILQSLWHEATSGDNQFVNFGTETTRLTRGSISYNRAGGLVAYNTTSDYRAKTILGDIDNSGEAIDALKVYRGVMNGATVERPMLVAHEAQEVAPYCVTGEKDAVDDDGNPIYQQMDHQALVPLLIAEIQQLRNRVAALEGA